VAATAQAFARLRGMPAEELARVTTENARRALHLPDRSP
jgi:Tat protein secretion system quality control protein TatD with DNase activity